MLSTVSKKLRLIWSRIRWLICKRPRPKVIIRRLGKKKMIAKDRCKWEPGSRRLSRFHRLSPQKPIRVATFNVAMFHLAPAVPRCEDVVRLGQEEIELMENNQSKAQNCHPKSILKQSPLHSSSVKSPEVVLSRSKQKVSINLPDNEISLANGKFLSLVEEEREGSSRIIASRNYRSSVVMRSPVSLPASYNNMAKYSISSEEDLASSQRRSILEVVREVGADVLALQDVRADEERDMRPLSDLAASLGMKYVFAESWAPEYGNAILSKWPIKRWKVEKIANDEDHRNVLKATIDVPWAGEYYEDIGKPTPRVKVMEFLKAKGYTDSKEYAGECEPVVIIAKGQNVQGTCKYGTRVDYVLTSPDSKFEFVPGSYSVISSKGTSDHHIVTVDITKAKESNGQAKKAKQRIVRITEPWRSRGIWKV
ncbi:hypothetical protein LINGRAHAP2_LOCUS6416 [Linum grandiflorum]